MKPYIFIRHGETVLNVVAKNPATAVLYGCTETPLTPFGRAQAAHCARLLQPFVSSVGCIVTSCLERAIETQQIITAALKADWPIVRTPLLNERSLGDFEGLPVKSIEHDPVYGTGAKYAQFTNDFIIKAPNGENYTDVTKRVLQAFRAVQADYMLAENIVFVAHGDVIRCLIGALLQLPESDIIALPVENCVPIVVTYSQGVYTV